MEPQLFERYQYRLIPVVFMMLCGWLVIIAITYVTCIILYPLSGYIPRIHFPEMFVILGITLFVAQRICAQPVFELSAYGIRQGDKYVAFNTIKRIEQRKHFGVTFLYILEKGNEKPIVTIAAPNQINYIDQAIAAITTKSGRNIILK